MGAGLTFSCCQEGQLQELKEHFAPDQLLLKKVDSAYKSVLHNPSTARAHSGIWQKYDLHPTRLAVGLKQGLNMQKIWLIIKHSTAAAIRLTLIGTLEFAVALCF